MFFKPKLMIGKAGVSEDKVAGAAGLPIHIIPRAQCSFTREKLPGANSKARRAVKLRAMQNAPTNSVQVRITPDENDATLAGVWSWPALLGQSAKTSLYHPSVLPETLAREGLVSGARVINCVQGCEGQIWSDGALTASRWWPKAPTEQEWVYFLRAGKIEITPERLAARMPVEAAWRSFSMPFDRDPENLRRTFNPTLLALLAGVLLSGAVAFNGVRAAWYAMDASAIKSAYAQHINENRPAMAERRRALSARNESQKIAGGWPQARASDIITAFLAEVPSEAVTVSSISISGGEFVARGVQQTEVDHADLVARLEKSVLLTGVNVEIEPNNAGFVINATIPELLATAGQ